MGISLDAYRLPWPQPTTTANPLLRSQGSTPKSKWTRYRWLCRPRATMRKARQSNGILNLVVKHERATRTVAVLRPPLLVKRP
jgi:hypothetical protein